MIWPIVAIGTLTAGGGVACGFGIPVASGTRGDVKWRTRWACNRVKAEVRVPGGAWELVGTVTGWDRETMSDAKMLAEAQAQARAIRPPGTGLTLGAVPAQKMVQVARFAPK